MFYFSADFPTTRTELNAVFDVFDKHGRGELDYKEFMAALKPDRQAARRVVTSQQSESQAIHDEIEQQVASCQCRSACVRARKQTNHRGHRGHRDRQRSRRLNARSLPSAMGSPSAAGCIRGEGVDTKGAKDTKTEGGQRPSRTGWRFCNRHGG